MYKTEQIVRLERCCRKVAVTDRVQHGMKKRIQDTTDQCIKEKVMGKTEKQMTKRFLSVVLALALMVGVLPLPQFVTQARADSLNVVDSETPDAGGKSDDITDVSAESFSIDACSGKSAVLHYFQSIHLENRSDLPLFG